VKLPVRFLFLTNELPRLDDASTALASRFMVLRLTRSFFGVEDP
jgi:putative DNA primase/helicase